MDEGEAARRRFLLDEEWISTVSDEDLDDTEKRTGVCRYGAVWVLSWGLDAHPGKKRIWWDFYFQLSPIDHFAEDPGDRFLVSLDNIPTA